MTNTTTQDAVTQGIDDALAAMAAMESEPDTVTPKTKRKSSLKTAKQVKEDKQQAKAMVNALGSYKLTDNADATAIIGLTEVAANAVEAINSKDADLLASYLSLGEFSSVASQGFASKKIFGQYLADKLPASQLLDPALRSNCKWLYEAINGINDCADLMYVLGVNDIGSYKSQNPTVIRREYSAIKKAKQSATEGSDGGEVTQSVSKKDQFGEHLIDSVAGLVDKLKDTKLTKADIAASIGNLMIDVMTRSKTDALEYINTFTVQKASEFTSKEPEV